MTPQEPTMGVSDEARDLMGQLVSLAAFHDADLARNIAERLDAALPHMQPAGEAVACYRLVRGEFRTAWLDGNVLDEDETKLRGAGFTVERAHAGPTGADAIADAAIAAQREAGSA